MSPMTATCGPAAVNAAQDVSPIAGGTATRPTRSARSVRGTDTLYTRSPASQAPRAPVRRAISVVSRTAACPRLRGGDAAGPTAGTRATRQSATSAVGGRIASFSGTADGRPGGGGPGAHEGEETGRDERGRTRDRPLQRHGGRADRLWRTGRPPTSRSGTYTRCV